MDTIESFKKHLESNKNAPSKATLKNYLADLRQFLRWIEAKGIPSDPRLITYDHISEYLQEKAKLSPRSAKRYASTLRRYFTQMRQEGKITHDPFTRSIQEKEEVIDIWHLKDFKNHLYVYNSSNQTIKNYINDIKQFSAWIAKNAAFNNIYTSANILSLINSEILNSYKSYLRSGLGLSPLSVNRKLSSLRKYLSFAYQQGFLKSEPTVFENLPKAIPAFEETPLSPIEPEEIRQAAVMVETPLSPSPKKAKKYSSFPPLRVLQKLGTLFLLGFDATIIAAVAKALEHAQYLSWLASGKQVFMKSAKNLSAHALKLSNGIKADNLRFRHDILSKIRNEKREKIISRFNPLHPQFASLPATHRIAGHIRHTRPNWYRKYHSYPIVTYFHIAALVILMSALSFGIYKSLVLDPENQEALAALPTAPPRILSFQGRLTDANANPITSVTDMRFAIYNDDTASGSALLWQEVQSLTPDGDGIFSTLLGTVSSIPSTLFSENADLYLGITVEVDPELQPRQQLATVAYAANAETLQGLPPITAVGAGQTDVVLALDSSGDLTIGGSASPTFSATGGEFTLSGNVLNLTTTAGSNADVNIEPNGLGKIDLLKSLQNTSLNNNIPTAAGAVEVNDLFAVLATSSGQSAFTLNQNGGGPLISASASGIARFTVENDGSGIFAGDLTVQGGDVIGANGARIDIGEATSGDIEVTGDLLPATDASYDLGSTAKSWRDIYLTGQLCFDDTDCATSWATVGTNYWQKNAGALSPLTITDDLLVGGIATASANWQVFATGTNAGTASSSGQLTFRGTTDPKINILNGENFGIRTSVGGDALLTERFTILNNGNIGIGTTAPVFPLQVLNNSSSAFAAVVGPLNTSGQGAGLKLLENTLLDSAPAGFDLFMESNSNRFDIRSFSNNLTAVERLSILRDSGNVGIGTTTPGAALEISGAGDAIPIIVKTQGGVGGTPGFELVDPTAANYGARIYFDDTLSGLRLVTLSAGVEQNGIFINRDNGNVGIGMTGSNAELQVGGTTPELRLGDGDAEDTSLTFDGNAQNYYFGLDDTDDALKIGLGTAVGTTPYLTILSNGNIGIGSIAPTYKLDVQDGSGIVGQFSGRVIGGDAVNSNEFATLGQIAGGAGQFWQLNNGALAPSNITNDVLVGGSATASAKIRLGGTTNADSFFNTGGNVGIGTTTTGAKVDIRKISGSSVPGLIIRGGTTNTADHIQWADSSSNIQGVITSTGNLGIGTSTPLSRVSILGGSGTTETAFGFYETSGTGVVQTGGSLLLSIDDNNDSTSDVFALRTNGNSTQLFTIQENGNVGIGTSTPASLLNVVGSTGKALVTINETNGQDIFAASASGAMRFVITNDGNVGIGAGARIPETNLHLYDTGTSTTLGQLDTNLRLQTQTTTGNAGNEISFRGHSSATQDTSTYAAISAPVTSNSASGSVGYISFSTKANSTTTTLTEVMRISSSGNVGIGSTSPFYKFDVAAGTGIVGQFSGRVIGGNAVNSNEFVTLSQLTDGTGQYWQRAAGTLSPTNITDDVLIGGTANATASALIRLGGTTNANSFFNTGGNVGIGTTAPTRLLEVFANNGNTSTGQFNVRQDGSGDAFLNFSLGTTGASYALGIDNSDSDKFKIGYDGTGPNGPAAAARLTIDTSGNIGIATENPSLFKLQVAGHVGPNADDTYDLGSSTRRWRDLYLGPASVHIGTDGNEATIGYNITDNYIQLDSDGNGTPDAILNDSGDFGLGTTSPLAKLDVVGSASVSGDLVLYGATRSIQTTSNNSLTLGGDSTGDIVLSPRNGTGSVIPSANNAIDIGTAGNQFKNLYVQNIYQDGSPVNLTNYWQRASGALSPLDITNDVLIGGSSTASAKIRLGGTTNADSFFNTGGNVGIGTTSTTARLDISGNASLSGTLSFRGTTDPKIDILNGESFGIRTSVGGSSLSEKFTILNNGNVGIGTIVPVAGLQVFSGNAVIGSPSQAGPNYLQLVHAGSGATNRGFISFANSTSSPEGEFIFGTSGGTNLSAYYNSAEVFTIRSTGNVGIGSITPGALLDVAGNVRTSTQFLGNGSDTVSAPSFSWNGDPNTGMFTPGADTIGLTTGGTEKLRVTSSGEVSIGKTANLYGKFNLYDSGFNVSQVIGVLGDATTATATATLAFRTRDIPTDVGSSAEIVTGRDGIYGSAPTRDANLQFWVENSDTLEEKMRITSAGNVGIGSTAPAYKFDVQGGSGIVGQFSGRVIGADAVNSNEFATLGQISGGAGQYWQRVLGTLSPTNITDDVLVGGTATASALIRLGGTTNTNSFFNTGGNVGIGSISPAAKLDVTGTIAGSTTITAGTAFYGPIGSAGTPTYSITGDTNTGLYSGSADNLSLSTAGVQRVNIGSTGQIGFGIAATANYGLYYLSSGTSGSNQSGALIRPTFSSSGITELSGVRSLVSTQATTFTAALVSAFRADGIIAGSGSTITSAIGLDVLDQTAGTNNYGIVSRVSSGTNKYNIYANGTAQNYFAGNVGIGSTVPAQKLDILGVLKLDDGSNLPAEGSLGEAAQNAYIVASGSATRRLVLGVVDNNYTQAAIELSNNNSGTGSLLFKTSVGGAGLTTRMTIDSAGNVGIGSTSPTVKLDVVGGINATGNLDINGTANDIAGTLNLSGSVLTSTSTLTFVNGSTGLSITTDGVITDIDDSAVQIGEDLSVSGDLTLTGGDITGANGAAIDIGELTSGDITFTGDLIIADTAFLGLGASGGRLAFNGASTPDEIDVLDATLDLNTNIITNIGNAGTDFTSAGGLTLADSLDVNGTSNDIAGTLNLSGGALSSTGDLTISPAGNNVLFSDTTTLQIGGATAVAYNAISNSGGTPTNPGVTADNDLFVEGDLDVGGTLYVGGQQLTPGALTNYWQRALGAVSPANITDDILIGGTATASAKIRLGGTTNANSFFNTGGNVGIGTTNPVSIFEIAKASTYSSEGSAGISILSGATDSKLILGADATNDITYIQSLAQGTSYSSRPLTLQPNGGNIGVGTISPTALFDINGTASLSGTLSFRGATDPKIDILNGENFGIRTSVGGNSILSERFTVINSSGNVGIGTSIPRAKLATVGTAASPDLSSNTGIANITANTTQELSIGGDSNAPFGMWLQTKRSNSDGTNWPLAINPLGGNVGIGTLNPGTLLDVIGTGRFSGTLTANGSLVATNTFTLGDNGDTGSINTSDWDISTTGVLTGISGITNDGVYTQTGSSQNTFTGNIDASSGLDITGADLTVGGANFSVTVGTGNITTAGDLALNGGDITSTGDITINATGGQLFLADTNTIAIGGHAGAAYNAISNAGGTPTNPGVTADNDLYVQGDLDVGGTLYVGGSEVLPGGGYWQRLAGNLSPVTLNDTISATTSAATALTITQTGAFNAVLIEDAASDSTPFIINQDGNVGIGTTAAGEELDVNGDILVAGGGTIDTRAAGTLTIGGTTQTGLTLGRVGAATTINGSSLTVGPTAWTATPTISGLITATSGLTANGTLTANGVVTLGDGGDNFSVNSNALDISTGGAITGATGIVSSGTIQFSGVTASRAVFTDASSNLTGSGASAALLNALTDETGTGVAVFGTSPAITTSLTTGSTSFDLINTTATTVNFAGASTALTIGATTGTATIRNATTALTGNLDANGTANDIAGTLNLSGNILTSTGDLAITPTGGDVTVTGNVNPATDSTYDLGTSLVRWSNGYFDTLYGDGSNLTGITAGAVSFANITTGTNTTAAMTLGSGSSLTAATGVTVTGDSGSTFDINGDLAIADTNVAFDGVSTTFTTTGAFTLTPGGAVLLGDGGDTMQINTSDWDISTTGVLTGISGITTDGVYTQTGSSQNTFSGNVDATSGVDVTGASLTVGGANFSVTTAGALTAASTGAFGGVLQGGSTSTVAYSRLGTGTTTHSITGADSLLISGDGEVDGTLYVDGSIVLNGNTLTNYWQKNLGAIAPTDIADDVLIGGTATASALVRLPGTNNQNAFFNLGTGNLGVGTTTPVHKLELATHTTAPGGIGFGTDVELYRSAANTLSLATGDSFTMVSGAFTQTTPATTTTGHTINANSLTTGTGVAINSTALSYSSGRLLSVSKTGGSGGTAFTGDIANIAYSHTFNSGAVSHTGNVLDISRAITLNAAVTQTISGALATLSDSATQTAGTLNSTADVLQISQNYAANSGAALNVTTAGTGFALRVNDDGTLTDSTPFIVDAAGNVGIGTTTTTATFDLTGTLAQTSGQVTFAGNVDATSGLDITGANLTVGGANFSVTTAGVLTAASTGAFGGVLQGGSTSTVAYSRLGTAVTGHGLAAADDLLISGDLEVDGTFYFDGSIGTSFTEGSIVFAGASGVLAEDNSNFFWDDTLNRLGINTNAPNVPLDVNGTTRASSFVDYDNTAYYLDPAATGISLTVAGNVGIGTTTTNAHLNIFNTTGASILVGSTANAGFEYTRGNNDLYLGGDNTQAGNLHIKNSAGTITTSLNSDAVSYFNGGNVGIGTTTSSNAKLSIVNSGSTSFIQLDPGGSNNYADIIGSAGNGIRMYGGTSYNTGPAFQIWPTGSSFQGMYFDAGSATGADIFFRRSPNGTSAMTIKQSTGYIGIGTTAPLGVLHVDGAAVGKALVTLNQTGNQDIFTASASGATRFVIGNGGNVGIGTSNPEGLLHASGSDSNARIKLQDTSSPDTSITQTMSGLELLMGDANATNKYTPGIKFGSTDSNFTTTNPKFLAGIFGEATETYAADTDGGMALSFFTTPDNGGASSVPLVRMTVDSTGNVGIGSLTPIDMLDVTGNVRVGTGTTGCVRDRDATVIAGTCSSDARLKTNINSYINILDRVEDMRLVSYNWRAAEFPGYHFGSQTELGVIAQEIEPLFPELVSTDENGYKQVNYSQLNLITLGSVIELVKQGNNTNSNLSLLAGPLQIPSPADLTITNNLDDYTISKNGQMLSNNSGFAFAGIAKLMAGLTTTQKLIVNGTATFLGTLQAQTVNVLDQITASAANITGSLQAGTIITGSLAVSSVSIAGENLRDYIVRVVSEAGFNNGGNVTSPVGSFDNLATNVISPLGDEPIEVQGDITIKKTASSAGNLTVEGDASISGKLAATNLEAQDATISGTLRAGKIIADDIEGLEGKIGTLAATTIINNTNVYNIASGSGSSEASNSATASSAASLIASSITTDYASIASLSAALAYVPNLSSDFATFHQGLMAFGPSSLSDVSVAGQFSVNGSLIIADNSVNVLGGTLELQPLRQGNLAFMGGLVSIDIDGNMSVSGNAVFAKDVTIQGTLAAHIISPVPGSDLIVKLPNDQSSFVVADASGSAKFKVDNKGNVVASGSAKFGEIASDIFNVVRGAQADTSLTETVATASAGSAIVNSGQFERTIVSPFVTEDSLIYITPTSDTQGVTPFIARQTADDPETEEIEGSFTIRIPQTVTTNIQTNWWIVN